MSEAAKPSTIPPACKADTLDEAQRLRKRVVRQIKELPAEMQTWVIQCIKLDLGQP